MTQQQTTVRAAAKRESSLSDVMAVWLPSFVVVLAAGLCLFGLSWWISRGPQGGAHLGIIVGFASVDSLIWVMLLGRALDRNDRYVMALRLLFAIAVPITALVAIYSLRPIGLLVLAGGICYFGIHACQALYLATTENMVADLAPGHWPSTRTAMLGQLPQQVGAMVAPSIGGFLLIIGALRDIAFAALVVLAGTLVAVVSLRRRFGLLADRAAAARSATGPSTGILRTTMRDAAGAFRLIARHRELVYIIVLGALGNLVMFPFYAILPAFIREYDLSQHSQALLYGQAASGYALGLLVSTLLLMRWRHRAGVLRSLVLATLAFAGVCVLVVLVTYIQAWIVLVAAMVGCGLLFAVLMSVAGALWLDRTPAAIRVRVFALRRLVTFSTIPVGTMLMGFGGAAMGYHIFIRYLVLAVLAATVAWFLILGRSAAGRDAN
jgi:MFS family permease